VSSRPVPAELLPWALSALGVCNHGQEPDLSVIAGDASNRRYFRLLLGARNYVLAEAPPATEKNEAFLAVRDMLSGAGVKVPALYAADIERGYLLLEDLGDRVLLPELSAASTAVSIFLAQSASPALYSSIIATDRIMPTGLAIS